MGYSVTTPAGVMRPMLLPVVSVNQRLPSGPSVMSPGVLARAAGAESPWPGPTGVMRADPIDDRLGEPQVAVGALDDAAGLRALRRPRTR